MMMSNSQKLAVSNFIETLAEVEAKNRYGKLAGELVNCAVDIGRKNADIDKIANQVWTIISREGGEQ